MRISKTLLAIAAAALAASAACAQNQEFPAAPPLTGGPWVNGAPVNLASLKGKVVVLTFWTFQ